jgi:hypothetical protein
MIVRLLLALAVVIGLSAPAYARQCPNDIKKIDAALAGASSLPASALKPIKTLRDTGQRLHNAGKHADAVKTLAGAKQMLEAMGVKIN